MTPPPPISTLFPYTTLFRSPFPYTAIRAFTMKSLDDYKYWTNPSIFVRILYTLLKLTMYSVFMSSSPKQRFTGNDGKRSEEHTSELQSRENLVCRLLLEKKK